MQNFDPKEHVGLLVKFINGRVVNKINKNPEELATFLYEFTNLTEEQYYYLMGTAKSVVHGNVSIAPVESHGLDLKYILSLNLPKATRTVPSGESGSLSDEEMKNIGFEAYNKASAIFKDELNINLGKDNVDLGIFTSAGYVYLNGKETVAVRDGLYEIAGAKTCYNITRHYGNRYGLHLYCVILILMFYTQFI